MDGDTLLLPMELIEGPSLASHLRAPGGARLLLADDAALALMVPICEGVGALHASGIMHRDLKPPNVMLVTVAGALSPKVIDLGAALEQQRTGELTRATMVIGTPAYLSPEQAEGRRDLDARVDVYALGVMLYEMLTGRRPYEGESDHAIFAMVLRRDPYPPIRQLAPSVDVALAELVERAFSHDRERRFPDARAMADALRALWRKSATVDASLPSQDSARIAVAVSSPRPARSRPLAFVLGTLTALAVVSITMMLAGDPTRAGVAVRPATRRTSEERTTTSPPLPEVSPPTVEQHLTPPAPTPAPDETTATSQSDAGRAPATPQRSHRLRRCRPRPGVICPP
jgi:serine/threonine-protein kinase